MRAPEPETVVEIALVLFAALIGLGVAVLLGGRVGGAAAWGAGDTEAPPPSGSMPRGTHQNIGTSSPR